MRCSTIIQIRSRRQRGPQDTISHIPGYTTIDMVWLPPALTINLKEAPCGVFFPFNFLHFQHCPPIYYLRVIFVDSGSQRSVEKLL